MKNAFWTFYLKTCTEFETNDAMIIMKNVLLFKLAELQIGSSYILNSPFTTHHSTLYLSQLSCNCNVPNARVSPSSSVKPPKELQTNNLGLRISGLAVGAPLAFEFNIF